MNKSNIKSFNKILNISLLLLKLGLSSKNCPTDIEHRYHM